MADSVEVPGIGEVTKEEIIRVAKWVGQAHEIYQDASEVELIMLTRLFEEHHWEMEHPLAECFDLFSDHAFSRAVGFGNIADVQRAICDEFVNCPPGPDGVRRMFLSASRGCGKSVIVSSFCAWLLVKNPNEKILLISSSAKQAMESLSLIKQIMGGSEFAKHLLPGSDDTDSQTHMDINSKYRDKADKDASILAAGATSQITGRHPSVIILDDVESADAGKSEAKRESLLRKIKELPSMIRTGDGIDSRVYLLGTPHHSLSVYTQLADNYARVRYPIYYPDPTDPDECKDVSSWMMDRVSNAPELEGESVYPERFPEHVINEKRIELGPVDFALQFLLTTESADAVQFPLKLVHLPVISDEYYTPVSGPAGFEWAATKDSICKHMKGHGDDRGYYARVNPEISEFRQVIATIDPAVGGKSERGLDCTAICISTIINGYVHILSLDAFEGGFSPGVQKKICKLLNEWGVREVRIESNAGGQMSSQLLAAATQKYCDHKVGIESFHSTGAKEERIIDTVQPLLLTHRVAIRGRASRNGDWLSQFINLQNRRRCLKHDDLIDVFALALGYYVEQMSLDPTKLVARATETNKDKVRREWEEQSRDIASTNWDYAGLSGGRRFAGDLVKPVAQSPLSNMLGKFGRRPRRRF